MGKRTTQQDLRHPLETPTPTFKFATLFWNLPAYPGRYLVRGFSVEGGLIVPDRLAAVITSSFEDAQSAARDLSTGKYHLARHIRDQKHVVETWV
jgi:hypothetical protein